jgi:hypothetical protein
MAFSLEEKVDLLLKKIAFGKTKTDTSENVDGFGEAVASPLLLRADKVLQDSASIPGTPAAVASVVQAYQGTDVIECIAATGTTDTNISGFKRAWQTVVNAGTDNAALTDWIPPEFGPAYTVEVYVGPTGWNGTDTPATTIGGTDGSGTGANVFRVVPGVETANWIYDYQAGVLYWTNENETGGISNQVGGSEQLTSSISSSDVVYIKGYRYIGNFGVGGSSASTVTVAGNGDNTAFPLVFTSGANSSASLLVDDSSPVTYNPSTGALLTGALSASVSFSTGTLQVNGNTTLGDQNTDTINLNARFVSDLLPSTTNARDLGSNALKWAEVHATTFTGALTGDVTGNADTATKIASITNSNIVQLAATQTLTNKTLTSPTLTTPALGTPASGNLANCTFPTLNQNTDGTAANVTGTVAIANGGTGATTATAARTALGLAIGSNVQAYDAGLSSIAGLTTVADKMIFTTASDTYAVTGLTSFARTILDDADAVAVRGTLGLGSISTQASTNVDIDGGNIDGATIATSNITVGAGKTLDVSAGTLTLAADQISGDAVSGGTIGTVTIGQLAGAMDANSQAITNVNIDSGAIDGTTIGANTKAAASFTDVTITGDLTVVGSGSNIILSQENVVFADALLTLGNADDGLDSDYSDAAALGAGTKLGIEAYKQNHNNTASPSLIFDTTNGKKYWAIDNKDHGSSAEQRIARIFKVAHTISTAEINAGFFTVTHNLNHEDLIVQVRDNTTDQEVIFFKYKTKTAQTIEIYVGANFSNGDVVNVVVVG